MTDIKATLTRKLGPLPAWGWALLVIGAIYFYRKYTASKTATTATPTTTPLPSDAGTILQPGESVVGPDGSLTTAPGGGASTGGSDTTDPSAAIGDLANAITAAIAAGQAAQAQPTYSTSPGYGIQPLAATPSTKLKKAVATPKKKGNPIKPKSTSTSKKPSIPKVIKRSIGSRRNYLGGRSSGKSKPSQTKIAIPSGGTVKRTVKATSSSGTRRARPLTPMVAQAGPTQRPVATHPKSSVRSTAPAPPPPRPSAPAPTVTRRVVAAKPKPAPARPR